MNITITRKQSTSSGTPGDLAVTNPAGDTFACKTLLNSRATLAQLIEFVGAGGHNVDYHWAQGCEPTACHA